MKAIPVLCALALGSVHAKKSILQVNATAGPVHAKKSFLQVNATAGVCNPASNSYNWPFTTVDSGTWHSCKSSGGSVNDLGTAPQMCEGDPASVRIGLNTAVGAECLVASAPQCKIPMHDFKSLDYDFHIRGCMAVWAAPLWMIPDKWQYGSGSGEIDAMEMCPRDKIYLNFAGGGHQTSATGYSIDNSDGHITVRKDDAGIVTIAVCTQNEARSLGGQCPQPDYGNCQQCLNGENGYACFCDDGSNIYGSGGCVNGGDCMWTLTSDLWNGLGGDDGYNGCMTAAGGVEHGQPNMNSRCAFSVQNILVKGGGPNESLQWGPGSPSSCSVLTPAAH